MVYITKINMRNNNMQKKEFSNIELINKNDAWEENTVENKYVALRDDSTIFVVYDRDNAQTLGFKKETFFQIEKDTLVYDKNSVTELPDNPINFLNRTL